MPKLVEWRLLHPRMTFAALGQIPFFLYEDDPSRASQQFTERYPFGGWEPFKGFKHLGDGVIKYPRDPKYAPLASAKLRDETIYFYQHSWVGIFQPDGTFEISRID